MSHHVWVDEIRREEPMLSRRQFSGALALSLTFPAPAFAQAAFPARPIKLILPYAAGGGTDAIARVVAQAMSEKLGQAVVIENISTGGGNVATATAASAAADGYTMLMANQGPIAVNPHIMKTVTVDTLTAFDAVTQVAETPLVVVVTEGSRYKSFGDLLAAMKKDPGKLTYGSAGNGSASHLATLLLAYTAKVEAVHVPYRGAAPAISDVLGGQTDFIITTIPSVIGLVDSGKMRALAAGEGPARQGRRAGRRQHAGRVRRLHQGRTRALENDRQGGEHPDQLEADPATNHVPAGSSTALRKSGRPARSSRSGSPAC
jgi:tripartite-type tricarboxylate transporter receptor subunit TctC